MIIIETPAPPTRERLVLVRERIIVPESRDATPADLERAGWVTGEMLAEHVRIVWAAGQKAEPVGVAMLRELKERAEKAERELEDAESRAAHMLTVIRERDTLRAELERITAPGEGVRREQCLIARCVEAGLDLHVVEAHDDATRPGLWYIVRITESGGEETEETVPAADVTATLARLLGEVSRG